VETTEPTPDVRDKKTVLVVDDDPAILKTVSDLLGRDFKVLRAKSGIEALQLSKDSQFEISLLLSDFQMPGMSGVELATQLTAQRPEIKVLLMSGYPAGMLILNEGWHFLAKPFVPSQLRSLIEGLVSPDKASRFSA
jgi:CheY-like chemotaxis protein